MNLRSSWPLLILFAVLSSPIFGADEPAASVPSAAENDKFFETRIRPLLVERCQSCHGADKQKGNLRLDSLEAMVKGGAAGPALELTNPEESLLLVAVSHLDDSLKMPPDKKLSETEIADLTRWVKLGAPWPGATAPQPKKELDPALARQFWAFQPPAEQPIPAVAQADWPRNEIDNFLLADMESQGLHPAPPADKRTLLRRVTFDLLGLPPTPKEVEAFLADESPDAYAKLIERLLASPHYGERWGRHWLDVVRYADSNGLDENIAHGNAWRYRDYVVAAFNSDKPYDQFIREQIAGDLLPATEEMAVRHERLIATGFLSLGPKVLAEVDETKMEMDIIDEQIDTLGRTFLGLTVGCARCHDHKFDPITAEDYYALAGFFKSTRTMEHFTKIARWWENPIPTPADLAKQAAHQEQVAAQKKSLDEFVAAADTALQATQPGQPLPEKRDTLYPAETQAELKKLREALMALEKAAPEMPTAMGVTDLAAKDLAVHIRGNHLTLGRVVPRAVPAVLAFGDESALPMDHSGRLQLADWLVRSNHPLTARVMVNRVWRWHFGRGIVPSTDNFGLLGDRPTHPELLDWLARTFVADGWSIKTLHRRILLSNAYQMSSEPNPEAMALDPANKWHWRSEIRRLEAEAVRDSLLAVSGTLDRTLGGPTTLAIKNREFLFDHTSIDKTDYNSVRRSLYLPVVRNHLYDVFQLFDSTDATVSSGNRPTTTVAPQALFMMNSEVVAQSAAALAKDLLARNDLDEAGRVQRLHLLALSRPATEAECQNATAFLSQVRAAQTADGATAVSELDAWSWYCHTILAANEFLYLR